MKAVGLTLPFVLIAVLATFRTAPSPPANPLKPRNAVEPQLQRADVELPEIAIEDPVEDLPRAIDKSDACLERLKRVESALASDPAAVLP